MTESQASLVQLNREFSDRLRLDYPEQFRTLVQMHLSFELDLNTDDTVTVFTERGLLKKWSKFQKKSKASNILKSGSPQQWPGRALTPEGMSHIEELIAFLSQDQNIVQEGIFRRTGALTRQNELRNILETPGPLNLNAGIYTVHDCASVLKGFLADLHEPLLTDAHYPAYCQIADICNESNRQKLSLTQDNRLLIKLQLLLLLLPVENRSVLEKIIFILHRTIQYESSNKMSAASLATLFAPHLICPRKLSPESLHSISQSMASVVSFMIAKGPPLFNVPERLATDVRAYLMDQKRKKTLASEQTLDESVTSDSTANTVFTFIDREKTAEAHISNPTDTALAQLYAHIQSLPESSKKRKLIKQFNKENGQGTPLQQLMANRTASAVRSGRSLGDSIKKHIFHKAKTPKRTPFSGLSATPMHERNASDPRMNPKTRLLFQSPPSSPSKTGTSIQLTPAQAEPEQPDLEVDELVSVNVRIKPQTEESAKSFTTKLRFKSEPNLSRLVAELGAADDRMFCSREAGKLIKGASLGNLATETNTNTNDHLSPSCSYSDNEKNDSNENEKLANLGRHSMSPITKSTQRMPKSMQESIMTPRSRKPVMLFGAVNMAQSERPHGSFASLREEDEDTERTPEKHWENGTEEDNQPAPDSLTSTFRDYLIGRSVLTTSPADLSFSSQPDDFGSSLEVLECDEAEMSDSLLYCLDGNSPADKSHTDFGAHRKRHGDCNQKSTVAKRLLQGSSTDLEETSL